jgi:hypothetical protein
MAIRTTGLPVLPVHRLHGLYSLHIQPLHPLAGQVSPLAVPFVHLIWSNGLILFVLPVFVSVSGCEGNTKSLRHLRVNE